jgi:hypothetical protein
MHNSDTSELVSIQDLDFTTTLPVTLLALIRGGTAGVTGFGETASRYKNYGGNYHPGGTTNPEDFQMTASSYKNSGGNYGNPRP